MAINKAWHEAHPMPKNATIEERIHWHLAHAAACGCRDIPKSVTRELEARGLTVPTRRSLT